MDYTQRGSVFSPGLAARGPVYNSNFKLDGLPQLSSTTKIAIVGALLAAGLSKKIPLMYAGIGAAVIWTLFPDQSIGAAANATSPGMPLPPMAPINIPISDIGAPQLFVQ
jgi:hypothetical protein